MVTNRELLESQRKDRLLIRYLSAFYAQTSHFLQMVFNIVVSTMPKVYRHLIDRNVHKDD